jgi:hypothetical protein
MNGDGGSVPTGFETGEPLHDPLRRAEAHPANWTIAPADGITDPAII